MPLPTKTPCPDRTELTWPCGCWATVYHGTAARPLKLTHHQCPDHVNRSPEGILHELSTCNEPGLLSGSVGDYRVDWGAATDPQNPATASVEVESGAGIGLTFSIDFDSARAKGKNHDNMVAMFEAAELA